MNDKVITPVYRVFNITPGGNSGPSWKPSGKRWNAIFTNTLDRCKPVGKAVGFFDIIGNGQQGILFEMWSLELNTYG